MKLKPGFGYWDTTKYPFGGCFKRSDKKEGKEIIEKLRDLHGRYIEVLFADGTIGAVGKDHILGKEKI